MINNKKGYLLVETLIAITIVAAVITAVYTLTMNYYVKTDNQVTKFNTPQGLYTAKQVKKYFAPIENDLLSDSNFKRTGFTDLGMSQFNSELNISNIYLCDKDLKKLLNGAPISNKIKKNIKDYEDEKVDKCDYKYVIIFKDDSYSIVGTSCSD